MIVFETGGEPSLRAGEEEIGGRRIAGRLLPYGLEADARPLRFDPIARRFGRRRGEGQVSAGPAQPDAWRVAALRLPAGPVLVGPGSSGEAVRGAYGAAVEGAWRAGKALFLLDPYAYASELPGASAPAAAGDRCVILASFDASGLGQGAFPSLATARSSGAPRGVLFPLIPDWTAEDEALEALLSEAAAEGARFATPLVPESDGEARRAIVEARPNASEEFFERIHHQDWAARMTALLPEVRRRCAAHGLAVMPPRPVGSHEPAGNAAASSRLEDLAEADGLPEHRAALFHAAARWIDECGRDLAAVAREGNFRKVFPFEAGVAREAEAVLSGASAWGR